MSEGRSCIKRGRDRAAWELRNVGGEGRRRGRGGRGFGGQTSELSCSEIYVVEARAERPALHSDKI